MTGVALLTLKLCLQRHKTLSGQREIVGGIFASLRRPFELVPAKLFPAKPRFGSTIGVGRDDPDQTIEADNDGTESHP